jgi:hypothetical protein
VRTGGAVGNDAGAAKAKMFDFFASGEGHTLLHSATNTIPKLKEVNHELVKDVDKRIRASNKLLDTQQQNLGRVFASIDGIHQRRRRQRDFLSHHGGAAGHPRRLFRFPAVPSLLRLGLGFVEALRGPAAIEAED